MGSPAAIVFTNRADAGRRLAKLLMGLKGERPIILGLPRGGVAVAAQVAHALHATLDVILVRKLGAPSQPELAIGAIGEDGVRVLNREARRAVGVDAAHVVAVETRERDNLERMARTLRRGRPPIEIRARTVVVVDDGIATGATARAACQVARARGASRIVLAAPVIPRLTFDSLHDAADDIVCVAVPEPFFAIGEWYSDFSQLHDDEVVRLLEGGPPTTPSIGSPPAIASGSDPVTSGQVQEERKDR